MSSSDRRRSLLFFEATSPGLASRVSRLQRLECLDSDPRAPRPASRPFNRLLGSTYHEDQRPRFKLKSLAKCLVKVSPLSSFSVDATATSSSSSTCNRPDPDSSMQTTLSQSESRLVSVLKALADRKRKRCYKDDESKEGPKQTILEKRSEINDALDANVKRDYGGKGKEGNLANVSVGDDDDNNNDDDDDDDGLELSSRSKRARRDTSSSMASSMTMETMPPLFSSNAAIIRETTANLVSRETSDLALNALLTRRIPNTASTTKTRGAQDTESNNARDSGSIASCTTPFKPTKSLSVSSSSSVKQRRNAILSSLSTTINSLKRPREEEKQSTYEKDLKGSNNVDNIKHQTVKDSGKKSSSICSPDKYDEQPETEVTAGSQSKRTKIMVDKGTDSPIVNRGLLSIPVLAHLSFSPRPKDPSHSQLNEKRVLTPKDVDEGRKLAQRRANKLLSIFEDSESLEEGDPKRNQAGGVLTSKDLVDSEKGKEDEKIKTDKGNMLKGSVDQVDTGTKKSSFPFQSTEKANASGAESTSTTTVVTEKPITTSSSPRVIFNLGNNVDKQSLTPTTTAATTIVTTSPTTSMMKTKSPSFTFGAKDGSKTVVSSSKSPISSNLQFANTPKVVPSPPKTSPLNQQLAAQNSLLSALAQKSQVESSMKTITSSVSSSHSPPSETSSTDSKKVEMFKFTSPTTSSPATLTSVATTSTTSGFTFGSKKVEDVLKKTVPFSFGLNSVATPTTTTTNSLTSVTQPSTDSSQLGSIFKSTDQETTSVSTPPTMTTLAAAPSAFNFSLNPSKTSTAVSEKSSTNFFGTATSTTTVVGSSIFSFGQSINTSTMTSATTVTTTTNAMTTSSNLFQFGNQSGSSGSTFLSPKMPTPVSTLSGNVMTATESNKPNIFGFGKKSEPGTVTTTTVAPSGSQQTSRNLFGQPSAVPSSAKNLFGVTDSNINQQVGHSTTKGLEASKPVPSIFGSQTNEQQQQSSKSNVASNVVVSSSPFVFGQKTTSVQAPSGFAFGPSSSTTGTLPHAKDTSKPFSFGTSSQPSGLHPSGATSNPFQFGATSNPQASLQQTPQNQSSPFSFGHSKQPTTPQVGGAQGTMSFGNVNKNSGNTFAFGAKSSSTSGAFTSSTQPPSVFGGSNTTGSNTPFGSATLPTNFSFGASKPSEATPSQAAPFAFGGAATPATSLTFGAPTTPMASPPASMFSIGSGTTPATSQKTGRTIARARRTRRP